MHGVYTAKALIRHLWRARHWSKFHSPYLYQLFTACCIPGTDEGSFTSIEQERAQLLRSQEVIDRTDFGAGFKEGESVNRQAVKRIAKHALSLPSQCRFMSRLARFAQPARILELGTSLGIMTAYLKAGYPGASITTVEGDPEVSKVALATFHQLAIQDIQLINSSFEDFFRQDEFRNSTWDLVFIDGNHRSSALLFYFDILRDHLPQHAIVIVDDIYWSKDMTDGWNALINMQEVTQSVDCFRFGLLFFNTDFLQKENHRISLPR